MEVNTTGLAATDLTYTCNLGTVTAGWSGGGPVPVFSCKRACGWPTLTNAVFASSCTNVGGPHMPDGSACQAQCRFGYYANTNPTNVTLRTLPTFACDSGVVSPEPAQVATDCLKDEAGFVRVAGKALRWPKR